MKLHSLLAGAALCSLVFSCKKENVSDDGSNVRYQLLTSNSSSSVGAANSDGSSFRTDATITWNSGYANVTELKFEAKSRENDISYRSRTDHRINLFDPAATLGSILIPSGEYNQVKFKIGLAPTSTEPALELAGNYNGTPIVLRVTQPIEIKGVQRDVTVTDDNGYTAITDLNLATIMNDVSANALDNATRTNGQIIISSSSNSNIYNKLVRNLRDRDNECRWKRD
jgi:hypothetical protein